MTPFKSKFDEAAKAFQDALPGAGYLIIADSGSETGMAYTLSDEKLVEIFTSFIRRVESKKAARN